VDRQIGSESNPQEFIVKLVDLFCAIGDTLLRPDGSLWVNLGDTWSGSGGAGGDYNEGGLREGQPKWKPGKSSIPRKSLTAIPERFLIAMIDRGWICRNKPIWFKGKDATDRPDDSETVALTSNGMPISAEDRLKETWEQWYHFVRSNKPVRWVHQQTCKVVTKKPRQEYEPVLDEAGNQVYLPNGKPKQRPLWVSEDYFYNLDEIREPMVKGLSGSTYTEGKTGVNGLGRTSQAERIDNPLGRNPGDLWFVPLSPFPLAHFACYPPGICEIPAKATIPQAICKRCGCPRQAVYAVSREYRGGSGRAGRQPGEIGGKNLDPGLAGQVRANHDLRMGPVLVGHIIGYTDCGCGAGYEGAIALDPFFGSGSTAQGVNEAVKPVTVDGDYCAPTTIGIDLDERNLSIIEARLTGRARQKRKTDTKPYNGGLFALLEEAEANDAAAAGKR
jgi:hypothetical protein